MFQSFPLGDRSSVNLRGEYHVENVTSFENIPAKQAPDPAEAMEVDANKEESDEVKRGAPGDGPSTEQIEKAEAKLVDPPTTSTTSKEKQDTEATLSMDELYPIFWSLQANFSTPTRLFEENNFQDFKKGLHLTMNKLRSVHQDLQGRGSSKVADESQHGTKRKRGEDGNEPSISFNPKYLTSRDLFELEVIQAPLDLRCITTNAHCRSATLRFGGISSFRR